MRALARNGEQGSILRTLGCPDKIPDNSTIWLFRERMSELGVDTVVWQEFQRQLDLKGLKIEQGSAQGKALLSDSGFHPSLCFRMQRLCMLNPVIVRKTRREESRQKHDGIKMEKSCPRMAKYTMAINFIPSWIRRTILFDALKPPRQMFMIVRWICQKKGKWSTGIGDIREQNVRDIVPQ